MGWGYSCNCNSGNNRYRNYQQNRVVQPQQGSAKSTNCWDRARSMNNVPANTSNYMTTRDSAGGIHYYEKPSDEAIQKAGGSLAWTELSAEEYNKKINEEKNKTENQANKSENNDKNQETGKQNKNEETKSVNQTQDPVKDKETKSAANQNQTAESKTSEQTSAQTATSPQRTTDANQKSTAPVVKDSTKANVTTNPNNNIAKTNNTAVSNQPAAKDLYKSNNPYATIARCYTGNYKQIYDKCVTQGAQQGARHGAAIGSTKGFGGPITRIATNIGANQGYQQGYQQGAQTAAQVENSLRRFANAKPEDSQNAIAKFQNDLKNIDASAQANIRNTYAQHGLCAPANCGNAELQQSVNQMGMLSQIPLPVANELVNQTPDKLRTTLDELQKAGDSKVKQATALAKNCPDAISSMVEDAINNSVKAENSEKSNYDLKQDLQQNGGELLDALANLPNETKQKINDSIVEMIKGGMKDASDGSFDIDKFVDKDNLNLVKDMITQNPDAVGKLMGDVVDSIDKFPDEALNESKKFNDITKMLTDPKVQKMASVMAKLDESGILDALKKANPEAYNKIQSKFFAFNSGETVDQDDKPVDLDDIFDEV